jgi:hypothetical protein
VGEAGGVVGGVEVSSCLWFGFRSVLCRVCWGCYFACFCGFACFWLDKDRVM